MNIPCQHLDPLAGSSSELPEEAIAAFAHPPSSVQPFFSLRSGSSHPYDDDEIGITSYRECTVQQRAGGRLSIPCRPLPLPHRHHNAILTPPSVSSNRFP
jgi:hypothetical protein